MSDPAVIDEAPPVKRRRGGTPGNRGGKGAPRGTANPKTQQKLREAAILELAVKDVPVATIARAVNSSENNVRFYIAKHRKMLDALDQVEAYRESRARILTAGELTLFQSMMEDGKLAKASVNNLAYAYRQIHDTRRLEEGLSTANTSSTVRFTRVDVVDRTSADPD